MWKQTAYGDWVAEAVVVLVVVAVVAVVVGETPAVALVGFRPFWRAAEEGLGRWVILHSTLYWRQLEHDGLPPSHRIRFDVQRSQARHQQSNS